MAGHLSMHRIQPKAITCRLLDCYSFAVEVEACSDHNQDYTQAIRKPAIHNLQEVRQLPYILEEVDKADLEVVDRPSDLEFLAEEDKHRHLEAVISLQVDKPFVT